jgi:predicted acetyltransferase
MSEDLSNPRVSVRLALAHEEEIISAMLPSYLAELQVGPEYPYLGLYWKDENRRPYIIQSGQEVAGFALVRQEHQGAPWQIAEFYIAPKFRRVRVGLIAALSILSEQEGAWRISVLEHNEAAKKFWRQVISGVINGVGLQEVLEDKNTVFLFTTAGI